MKRLLLICLLSVGFSKKIIQTTVEDNGLRITEYDLIGDKLYETKHIYFNEHHPIIIDLKTLGEKPFTPNDLNFKIDRSYHHKYSETNLKGFRNKHGLYIEWDKNGNVREQGSYKNDKKVGKWIYRRWVGKPTNPNTSFYKEGWYKSTFTLDQLECDVVYGEDGKVISNEGKDCDFFDFNGDYLRTDNGSVETLSIF